ncbi:hypothetical protein [Cytobacillus oceanisediminis]|uniref:hypothetical protein n=1 Tax=Cytobacillus oceanisediminis TaxID=665099 RepID=UPI003735CB70
MKVRVGIKGIHCERGGLVKIKGRLFADIYSGFNNTLKKEWEMFSTFRAGFLYHNLHGDERPITLADGDFLNISGFYTATLDTPIGTSPDFLKIGGYLLTNKSKYEVVTVNDLINITSPKTYWVRFDEGNRSVIAEFELEVTSLY